MYCIRRLRLFLPKEVILGNNVSFRHNAPGTVIHGSTIIGNNVKIYQNVTLGRADLYNTPSSSNFKGIVVEDNVIISAGAKVLCKSDILTIGENSIVAANSVLLTSVPKNEIWGGIPAKKIADIN